MESQSKIPRYVIACDISNVHSSRRYLLSSESPAAYNRKITVDIFGMALKFSEYLGPSSESHARLVQRNESEIKLLEEMRSYVEKRSKIDADYADKIAKLQSTLRYSQSASEEDSFLHKVALRLKLIKIWINMSRCAWERYS